MSIDAMVAVIVTLLGAFGGPPLIRFLAERIFNRKDKRLEDELERSRYERQREAYREDLVFDLLKSSLASLDEALEVLKGRFETQDEEQVRTRRMLDRVEQTNHIQNGLLHEISEALRSVSIYIQQERDGE